MQRCQVDRVGLARSRSLPVHHRHRTRSPGQVRSRPVGHHCRHCRPFLNHLGSIPHPLRSDCYRGQRQSRHERHAAEDDNKHQEPHRGGGEKAGQLLLRAGSPVAN